MRIVGGLLACLSVGAISLSMADPPAPSNTSAPASAPAPQAATPAATPAAVDPDEKAILARGYKPRMRNGEKVYCRREEELGSRLGGREVCGTAKSILASEAAVREDAEAMRRQSLMNPPGK